MKLGLFRKKYRSKRNSKFGWLLSVGTLCIILIVSFGLLGASYASWSQFFSISGTISTGNLNIVVRDVALESSDGHESLSFTASKEGGFVDEVVMNVVTEAEPFGAVLVFTVENDGTLPVVCEGIDKSVAENLEVQLLDAPPRIEAGQTASIRVRIMKGYCENFHFSTFLRFEQAM